MDRKTLESMTINELSSLAATLKLDSKGSRDNIFDTIVSYYDRSGWPSAAPGQTSGTSPTGAVHTSGLSPAGDSSEGESPPCSNDPMREAVRYGSRVPTSVSGAATARDTMPDMQLIVDAVMQAMQRVNQQSISNQSRADASETQRSERNSGSSLPVWQSVKCAEKLIPIFSGKDEESVVKWLERITNIAQTYRFSNDVLLLATVSQLKDRALNWYNRQPLDTVSTWEEFKFQLRRYFERKETYSATMARISARIWNTRKRN